MKRNGKRRKKRGGDEEGMKRNGKRRKKRGGEEGVRRE